jgi:hypothetical protein
MKFIKRNLSYPFLRFIMGIMFCIISGVQTSPFPYLFFMGGVLLIDWIIFDKIGYRESHRILLNESLTYSEKKRIDSHEQQMIKCRRIIIPLVFIVSTCWYLLSKKHSIEWPIPVALYSVIISIHSIYSLNKCGFFTASKGSKRSDFKLKDPASPDYPSCYIDSLSPTSTGNPFALCNPFSPYNKIL